MSLKTYHQRADSPNFWGKHWKESLKGDSLKNYYRNSGNSFMLREIFEKYLPKKGKILEAGCGLGTYVYLLKQKKYDIEGMDFARDTIDFVKRNLPELPVRVGNVFKLDYPDKFFKGYISLGVVGHFEEGPEKILKEAARVLDKDGVIILSVPYFNPLRKVKNFLGFYKNQKGDFYQYFFAQNEIVKYIRKTNFKVIKSYRYNSIKGLKDEIFGIKKIRQSIVKKQDNFYERKRKFFLKKFINSSLMRFLFSHMIIIVAKKI